MKNAVVLLSGGLDSSTVATIAKRDNQTVTSVSFNYGQRHSIEMNASERVAKRLGIERRIINIDMRQIGGSSLTSKQEIERGLLERQGIPNTYVPGRNIIFLSIAGAIAEVTDSESVYIGVNSVDYSGYPDCRPDFISSMEETLNLGLANSTGRSIKIIAPLQKLSKGEIIKLGTSLGTPYELTYSCYAGGKLACGNCDSCLLRLKGFMEAAATDPIHYSELPEFYKKYINERKP